MNKNEVINEQSLVTLRRAANAISASQRIRTRFRLEVVRAEDGLDAARRFINTNMGNRDIATSDLGKLQSDLIVGKSALYQMARELGAFDAFPGTAAKFEKAADLLVDIHRVTVEYLGKPKKKEEKQK